MSNTRSKAFFINGGAGRVLCSIPAFEKYAEESGDNDFIIVCEGGTEFYKGHPLLDSRSYDHWHKNIFKDKLKNMDLVSPEPYRVWEYYNQKCSLAQAFDIEINNTTVRDIGPPMLYLSKEEEIVGVNVVEEVKRELKKEKVVVFQPFGRGIGDHNGILSDPSGRSFEYQNVINLIRKFQKEKWAVILMSELKIDTKKTDLQEDIAQPENASLRGWSSIIKNADLFIGCDSVGQHIAYITNTPTVTVIGSTYPINISYPETNIFKIMDLGEGTRQYSPIRIVIDEAVDRANERLMYMTPEIENYLVDEAKKLMYTKEPSKLIKVGE
jgi:ADP-heptose:LPS heptosyltransferase